MNELLPVLSGLFLGSILFFTPRSYRLWAGLILILLLGISATIISGEFLLSWSFLLIDIPLVAISAFAGFVGTFAVRKGLKTNV